MNIPLYVKIFVFTSDSVNLKLIWIAKSFISEYSSDSLFRDDPGFSSLRGDFGRFSGV